MPYEIVYREKYGIDGREVVYVKMPDKMSIIRLGSSISLDSGNTVFENVKRFFREVFLPQGYPESVSDDYWNYQVWDSVQAFCSTLTGTVTTQAIMKGVGVGDSTATPMSAAITWIMKDGTGMVGRILFAWWKGTSLDADCKKWRIFADVLNDCAMCIEMFVLPLLSNYSLEVLCVSTTMKAIVGVAGGATKAANTHHQAICNNIADVSAKDGSQETCLNLIGSIFGIFVLSYVGDSELLIQVLFIVFTFLHIFANYKAVKALKFNTLNRERFLIIIKTYLSSGKVENARMVNGKENIWLGNGLTDVELCGYRIEMGCSLKKLVNKNLLSGEELYLHNYLSEKRKYMVIICTSLKTIFVPLQPDQTASDVFCSYYHAILLGIATSLLYNVKLDILSARDKTKCPLNGLEEELKANVFSKEPKQDTLSRLERHLDVRTKKELGKKQKVPLEAITSVNNLIDSYFPQLIDDLEQTGWKTDRHHFPVSEWRGIWNVKTKSKDD